MAMSIDDNKAVGSIYDEVCQNIIVSVHWTFTLHKRISYACGKFKYDIWDKFCFWEVFSGGF